MSLSQYLQKMLREWLDGSDTSLQPRVIVSDNQSTGSTAPGNMVYEPLVRVSGAAGADDYDLAVNASLGTPSVFEYQVPAGYIFYLVRTNLYYLDAGMRNNLFGGIAALTNGIKVEIIDADGTTPIFDFTSVLTMKTNSDWSLLAGVDAVISDGVGPDLLPIRWTQEKAGKRIKMTAGQRFRVSVQDNISALDLFRWMAQGYLEAVT